MKKIKLSFMAKVFLMAVIPALIVCIFMSGGTFVNMKKNMVTEIKNTLRATAYSLNYDDAQERLDGYKETLGIDVTVFHDNIRAVTTVKGSVNTEADVLIYAEVKSGKEYFSMNANVNGQEYFGYYIPMYDAEQNFVGMTFAGKPTAEANHEVYGSIMLMVASSMSLVIAVFVIIGIITGRMVKVLKNSTEIIEEVSSGNFTVTADKAAPDDEIGDIYRKIGSLAKWLRDSILGVKNVAEKLNNASDELDEGMKVAFSSSEVVVEAVDNISHGVVSQADDVQSITQKIENVGQQIGIIQDSMQFLSDTSIRMMQVEENTSISVERAESENNIIKADIENVNEQITITSKSVEEIKGFVDVIKDIADQTNLLSLNATIEAARAGESGKGFAVVAEEIRKLSEQSTAAAAKVESNIAALTSNYAAIIQKMNVTTENIKVQSEQIEDTKKAFVLLGCDIKDTTGQIEDVAKAITELNKMKNKIIDAICSLSAVCQENAASTEETTANMGELNTVIAQGSEMARGVKDEAAELMDNVGKFRV